MPDVPCCTLLSCAGYSFALLWRYLTAPHTPTHTHTPNTTTTITTTPPRYIFVGSNLAIGMIAVIIRAVQLFGVSSNTRSQIVPRIRWMRSLMWSVSIMYTIA